MEREGAIRRSTLEVNTANPLTQQAPAAFLGLGWRNVLPWVGLRPVVVQPERKLVVDFPVQKTPMHHVRFIALFGTLPHFSQLGAEEVLSKR